jgi:hypothetical protein
VVGIGREAVARHLAQDGGAAGARHLFRLEDQAPAPSPITKPSRVASKGRLAVSGSSFRVDMAFMAPKPATVSGVMVASEPPADHDIDVAALDGSEGFADGVRGGGAGGHGGEVRTLGPVTDGDQARARCRE